MNRNALYIRLQAKPEKAVELEEFINNKLHLIQKEEEALTWYAIKLDPSNYGLFVTFENEVDLKMHIAGPFMDELNRSASHMLSCKPEYTQADLIATKIGAQAQFIAANAAANAKKYDLRFIDGL